MNNSRLVVVLSIAAANLVAVACTGQPGPLAGRDFDVPLGPQGGAPTMPNGATPACLADLRVRAALDLLGSDRLDSGSHSASGTPEIASVPDVPLECRHILADVLECALGDDQSVADQDTGAEYTGRVGLARDWMERALTQAERRWVSGCMIQRLNYFGISVPILIEGDTDAIAIDTNLQQDYPFAESTAWGDIFNGNNLGEFAWVCTDKDVWYLCSKDLGEPWVDERVCDGVQDCGIHFVGRCEDACTETPEGYWDCSASYGFTETVRVRMETNTHPPVLGPCE